jgi:hypothetical protein
MSVCRVGAVEKRERAGETKKGRREKEVPARKAWQGKTAIQDGLKTAVFRERKEGAGERAGTSCQAYCALCRGVATFRTLWTTRGCTRSTRARGACVLTSSPTMREVDKPVSGSTSKVEAGIPRRKMRSGVPRSVDTTPEVMLRRRSQERLRLSMSMATTNYSSSGIPRN